MKMKRFLVTALTISLLFSQAVFAGETSLYGLTTSEDTYSEILDPAQRQSQGRIASPRGSIISIGQASISNDGDGRIGVYVYTGCHVSVDRIFMRVYLDSWNESRQAWQNEGYYEFEHLKKNEPSGTLYGATADFQIAKMPTNKYYRLRCVHVASNASNFENLISQTDGVLITK